MNVYLSIKLKAAILLLVFGLNTVVGFACSLGVDMGFNSTHHSKEATTAQGHVHTNGKIHHHEQQENAGSSHHKQEKNNCCNDEVIKVSQVDKSSPQSNIAVSPLFLSAFITKFYDASILSLPTITTSIKQFVRSYHPPIRDIRIAIQSFQI